MKLSIASPIEIPIAREYGSFQEKFRTSAKVVRGRIYLAKGIRQLLPSLADFFSKVCYSSMPLLGM